MDIVVDDIIIYNIYIPCDRVGYASLPHLANDLFRPMKS